MKPDPQKNRLYKLFGAQADGTISPEEHAELQECLRNDPDARRLWFAYQDVDDGLIESAADRAAIPPTQRNRTTPRHRFQWRILTSAAAGVAIGLFTASMVFAYTGPRRVKQNLALANPSFEDVAGSSLKSNAPLELAWVGAGTVVEAQQGFEPAEGQQMLRLQTSKPTEAHWGAFTSNAKISQVIDLRKWREALLDGSAAVDWIVYFNGSPGIQTIKTTYRVDARAYAGEVSVLEERWEERQNHEVAHCISKVESNRDPASWQAVSGSLILPPDTDFLLIELKLFQADRGETPIALSESQHFVDNMELSLLTSSHSRSVALTQSNP